MINFFRALQNENSNYKSRTTTTRKPLGFAIKEQRKMKLYQLDLGDYFTLAGDDDIYRLISGAVIIEGHELVLDMKSLKVKYMPQDLLVNKSEYDEVNELKERIKKLERLNKEITETWIMDY